ncbi:MAG: membrane dipeptidase [Nitratireductor sp.]|uniref:dipeptidase n=1 Tax=Alphaproteobacteria TaxID=28211 RepID=UPI0032831269
MNATAGAPRPITIDGLNCAAVSREQALRTLEGGVSAINLTAMSPFVGLADSLVELEANCARIDAMSDIATVVTSVADIEKAHRDGKLGYILGTQNSMMVEDDLQLLATMKRLGVRILQPTYNEENALGYGAPFEKDADKGMKAKGVEWIEEMTRLGLIIDLSHCGHRTTSAYLAAAKGPMVVSHANAFAVCPSLRNKKDEHIRAIAETGGLIGAVMWSPAVRHDQRPTLDDYLNHIDHHVKVGGIEHVAFASDVTEGQVPSPEKWDKSYGPNGYSPNITGVLGDWYTYENRLNVDFQSLAHTPRIWDGMKKRGYSETDIDKVRSGNWLRVMKDVWN